jgi:O-antigen/teichoic acid export membrane protein
LKSLPAWSWSIATNAINLAIGIVTGILVARLLGPAARGELAEVQFWAAAVAAMGICSLPSALSFFIARQPHQETFAGSALTLAAVLALVSVIVGLILIGTFVPSGLRNLTMMYLIVFIPANFVGLTLVAIDQGNQHFVRYNVFRLLPQATYLICALLLWQKSVITVPALLAASWCGSFLVCLGRWRLIGANAIQAPDPKRMKDLFQTGLAFHAGAFTGILFQNADRLICIAYFTHSDLGKYAVALTLSGAGLGLVSSATSIVLFPKLAAARSLSSSRHLIRNALGSSFVVALSINIAIALIIPMLLPLLFGSAFADAVPVATLLCIAQIPASFVQTAALALRALDDWRAGPYAQILALVIFVPAAATLIPRLGVNGIATSLLLSHLAAAVLILRRLHRKIGLNAFQCLTPEISWVRSQLAWWSVGTV